MNCGSLEKYISLMTDFDILKNEDIISIRDTLLQKKPMKYIKKLLRQILKSYRKAQEALKNEEEQFFTNEELNQMLPSHLRKSSKS